MSEINDSTASALEALRRGYQPIPLKDRSKKPYESSWTRTRWAKGDRAKLREDFDRWRTEEGAGNVGLLLGEPSGGLIDVDIDHPLASRFKSWLLPPTEMRSGRVGAPMSHYWYQVNEGLPATRRYVMPDGSVSVELRSTGAQTVIPPSIHPSGEEYRWEDGFDPWGGDDGPMVVPGWELAIQVAYIGMCAVLLENWPAKGSRHEAYLALAGGLLRYGEGVHPWWERNLPTVIENLADATHDRDGGEARVSEVMGTTMARLRAGERVTGFPRLGEIIGEDHAELVRRMATRDLESLGGFQRESPKSKSKEPGDRDRDRKEKREERKAKTSNLPPEERDPLGERESTWEHVDLDPYLAKEVVSPEASVLKRSDGKGLMYEGRVNLLFGASESAKSWIALVAAIEEMRTGGRVMYLDLEDEPGFTLDRLARLGVGADDIRSQFTYLRPEDPLQTMLPVNPWSGRQAQNSKAQANQKVFRKELKRVSPSLIVVDGAMVLFGLHNLDSNSGAGTDVIGSWLKKLTRGGKTTVIVIDHTGKAKTKESSPVGSHHKVALVQGTALLVWVKTQPVLGDIGVVELIVHKDRPGAVRQACHEEGKSPKARPVAAVVTLDSRVDDVTEVTVEPKPPSKEDSTTFDAEGMSSADEERLRKQEQEYQEREAKQLLFDRIKDILRVVGHPMSRTEITTQLLQAFPGVYHERTERQWRREFDIMVDAGWLVRGGVGKGARYALPAA